MHWVEYFFYLLVCDVSIGGEIIACYNDNMPSLSYRYYDNMISFSWQHDKIFMMSWCHDNVIMLLMSTLVEIKLPVVYCGFIDNTLKIVLIPCKYCTIIMIYGVLSGYHNTF
jgi:hypothetical protein